jgi:hypothetical protein
MKIILNTLIYLVILSIVQGILGSLLGTESFMYNFFPESIFRLLIRICFAVYFAYQWPIIKKDLYIK